MRETFDISPSLYRKHKELDSLSLCSILTLLGTCESPIVLYSHGIQKRGFSLVLFWNGCLMNKARQELDFSSQGKFYHFRKEFPLWNKMKIKKKRQKRKFLKKLHNKLTNKQKSNFGSIKKFSFSSIKTILPHFEYFYLKCTLFYQVKSSQSWGCISCWGTFDVSITFLHFSRSFAILVQSDSFNPVQCLI